MSTQRNRPVTGEGAGCASRADAARKLAHELNNLLDGSMRNVGLALRRLREEEAVDGGTLEKLATADDALKRMAVLLRDWMAGGRGQTAGATCLRDAVAAAVDTVGALAEARGVAIQVTLRQDVAGEMAGRVFPVIVNGLKNAVEASPRGSQVVVEAEGDGAWVEVRIVDEGAGVVSEVERDRDGLPVVGKTTKCDGHGLGLAICREAMTEIGGKLRLEDRPRGGAVLRIRWPRDMKDGV